MHFESLHGCAWWELCPRKVFRRKGQAFMQAIWRSGGRPPRILEALRSCFRLCVTTNYKLSSYTLRCMHAEINSCRKRLTMTALLEYLDLLPQDIGQKVGEGCMHGEWGGGTCPPAPSPIYAP